MIIFPMSTTIRGDLDMPKEYSRTSNTEKIINGHCENNVIGAGRQSL